MPAPLEIYAVPAFASPFSPSLRLLVTLLLIIDLAADPSSHFFLLFSTDPVPALDLKAGWLPGCEWRSGRGFGRTKERSIIARTTVTDRLIRKYYHWVYIQAKAQEIIILSVVDLVDLDCTVPARFFLVSFFEKPAPLYYSVDVHRQHHKIIELF